MNWFTTPTEDRAVSPVVGVALLIAIAVILAAVIGAVVLGIGVGMAEAPQASLEFEEVDDSTLAISHEGGDALDGDEIVLRGDFGDEVDDPGFNELRAGDSEELADDVGPNDEVSIVWQDPNSDDESVLATYNP